MSWRQKRLGDRNIADEDNQPSKERRLDDWTAASVAVANDVT